MEPSQSSIFAIAPVISFYEQELNILCHSKLYFRSAHTHTFSQLHAKELVRDGITNCSDIRLYNMRGQGAFRRQCDLALSNANSRLITRARSEEHTSELQSQSN